MASTFEALLLSQVTFMFNPPEAQLTQIVAQTSLAATTFVAITFTNSIKDNYSGHSNSTNPSRYTAQVAGTYSVSGHVDMVSTNNNFVVAVFKNGVVLPQTMVQSANSGTGNVLSAPVPRVLVPLAVGDYVEFYGQNPATWSTTTASFGGSNFGSRMDIRWEHQ